jgi:CheY-like chemotaxis protein
MMAAQLSDETICLLAENNDGYADLTQTQLRKAGVTNRLMRFHTGEEILAFLFPPEGADMPKAHPDYLLLVDVQLPELDGIQVWQRVKAEPAFQDLPVVMLTTGDDPRDVALGCRMGLQAH